MSELKQLIAIASTYKTALKGLLEFHEDNLCNISKGQSGCYCFELKAFLLNKMGEALDV